MASLSSLLAGESNLLWGLSMACWWLSFPGFYCSLKSITRAFPSRANLTIFIIISFIDAIKMFYPPTKISIARESVGENHWASVIYVNGGYSAFQVTCMIMGLWHRSHFFRSCSWKTIKRKNCTTQLHNNLLRYHLVERYNNVYTSGLN